MTWAAVLPAECDLPGVSCGAGGGSWWPLVLGVLVLGWAIRRGWPS